MAVFAAITHRNNIHSQKKPHSIHWSVTQVLEEFKFHDTSS